MEVKIAHSLDDFMKVMIIRSIIFMAEHGHKYNMEFDDYELSNRTHLLACEDNGEPIGIMRILKDGKEAKFERLAVIPEYRGKGISKEIIKAGLDFCQEQGVKKAYLFCEPPLVNYWHKKGFERIGGEKILLYRGLKLVPVMKKISTKRKELSEKEKNTLPAILLHQEGTWVKE